MKSYRLLPFFLACLVLLGRVSGTSAEEVIISGSGNPEYVLGRLAEAFNRQQSAHRVTIPTSTGTSGALRDVESGAGVLGRVGRPLKAEEKERGLVYLPLGRDAVVFAGGSGVTAKGVTMAQVLDVYGGKLANWQDLGGKPGPIRAIGRESTDASRQAIGRLVPAFANVVFAEGVKVVHLDPQMIELLDRFPGSFGFLNQSALLACKTRIVRLSLDGTAPTGENLASGRYPLWLELGLIHKNGSLTPGAKAFITFLQSPAGASILREHGIVTLPPADATR